MCGIDCAGWSGKGLRKRTVQRRETRLTWKLLGWLMAGMGVLAARGGDAAHLRRPYSHDLRRSAGWCFCEMRRFAFICMTEQPVARAGTPTLSLPPPSGFLTGCGRGRYRDPCTPPRGTVDVGIGRRLKSLLLAVAWFAVIDSYPAMARGGTNMHEMASSRHNNQANVTNSIGFTGFGHGRYCGYRTHKCVRPADFWR
jgi:hypothetical protein